MPHKLVREDQNAFHVIDDDGDIFPVAKKYLDDESTKKISGLEKFQAPQFDSPMRKPASSQEETNPVSESFFDFTKFAPQLNQAIDQEGATPPELSQTQDTQAYPSPTPQGFGAPLSQLQPQPQAPQPIPQRGPHAPYSPQAQTPFPSSLPISPIQGMQENMRKAGPYIDELAQAKKEESDELAKAYDSHALQMEALARNTKRYATAFQDEFDNLATGVKDAKIDPTRIWGNASTGNKILAGIGLILGGMGAGLAHQENLAYKTLLHLIDKDVEAQKATLENKRGLLHLNVERFGRLSTAVEITKNQYAAMLAGWIGKIGAQSASKQVQANAELAKLGLANQMLPQIQTLATQMAQAQMLGLGSGQGGIKKENVPFGLLSDPKFQERAIDVDGYYYQGKTPKAAENVRAFQEKLSDVSDKLNELNGIQGLGSRVLGKYSDSGRKAEQLKAAIITDLKEMKNFGGAPSEADIHLLSDMMSDPKSLLSPGTERNEKLKQMLQTQQEKIYEINLMGYAPKSSLGGKKMKLKGH
jgi:hypothetical protein